MARLTAKAKGMHRYVHIYRHILYLGNLRLPPSISSGDVGDQHHMTAWTVQLTHFVTCFVWHVKDEGHMFWHPCMYVHITYHNLAISITPPKCLSVPIYLCLSLSWSWSPFLMRRPHLLLSTSKDGSLPRESQCSLSFS
jgi:hypothetical protein